MAPCCTARERRYAKADVGQRPCVWVTRSLAHTLINSIVFKRDASELASTKRGRPNITPVSRRQDRPDAIAWLLRHHPELNDSQIGKLVGTTT